MKKIAVLGLHHDHVWSNVEELIRQPGVEVVAAADHHPALLEQFSEKFGGRSYADYDELLETEQDMCAVYIFASNKLSEELAVKALERGLHCLVEKPMAASLAGADAMLAAASERNLRLMVNWPFAWWPQLQHAMHLAASGEIGQLWQVKYRAAHEGPKELGCSEYFCEWLYDETLNGGGGAYMDYCCYGAVLAQSLLGTPTSVTGVKMRALKQDLESDDNAMLILSYPHALATTEGSWTQIGKMTAYTTVLYGSTGTLLIEPRHGGKLLKATADDPEGSEIPVPELPPHLVDSGAHFLHLIDHPEAPYHPLCDPQNGRDAQAILEAGLTAANEGRTVSMP